MYVIYIYIIHTYVYHLICNYDRLTEQSVSREIQCRDLLTLNLIYRDILYNRSVCSMFLKT